MVRHKHHFKIAFALAIAAGSWGVYWLPQRILEDGGLTGGWGTIAQNDYWSSNIITYCSMAKKLKEGLLV